MKGIFRERRLSKSKKITLAIILSLFLALIAELFLFNGFYWLHAKANFQPKLRDAQNVTVTKDQLKVKKPTKDASVVVTLPTADYSQLELAFGGKNYVPEASVTAYQGKEVLGIRSIEGRKNIFPVKQVKGPIKLVFSNVKRQKIPLKVTLKNQLTINWIRFAFVLASTLFALTIVFFAASRNYALFAFLAILIFGSISAIVIPPGNTFDERQHVVKALSVADGNLDFDNGERVEIPNELETLYINANQHKKVPYHSYSEYQSFLKSLDTRQNEKIINPQTQTTAVTYPFIQYLPESLGLKIANLMRLPNIYYIWFGRIANVLMYALLAFFAIKIVPQRKRLFTFFALQPVILYVAASNGFDGILTGVLLLTWAYMLKLRMERKKINPFSFSLIALLLALMIIFKVTYAPMLLMFFLLTRHNFRGKRQQIVYTSLLTVFLVAVSLGVYYYSSLKGIDQWGVAGADSAKQLQFILHNPLAYGKLMLKFYANNSIHYAYDFLGSLGHLPQLNALIVLFGFGFIIFLSLFDAEDPAMSEINELNYLTRLDKVVQIFQAICIGILSATALYLTFTPVASDTIAGFQARYMYPMIFPMFIVMSSSKIQSTFSKKSIHLWTLLIALGFIVYYVWAKVLAPYCM